MALAKRKSVRTRQTTQSRMFSNLVSGETLVGFEAISSIRQGYSAKILKAASNFFHVPETRIQNIVHIPATTASRLEKKEANIGSSASERIFRMVMVTKMAIEVFEDEQVAIEWMCTPNYSLGNIAPLDLMDTEPGAQSVRQILNAIASGGVA